MTSILLTTVSACQGFATSPTAQTRLEEEVVVEYNFGRWATARSVVVEQKNKRKSVK